MSLGFRTLDDVDVRGKTVLVRIDINVPYNPEKNELSDSERLRAHSETIRELSERGAKTVVLAHQGRRGDLDFIHLAKHAVLLSKHAGVKVNFVHDIIGDEARKRIKSLGEGEVLLLDNVRFLGDETVEKPGVKHVESMIVEALSPLADLFVNDAFSAAHRAHASIVGFPYALPSVAGRVMEREWKSCLKAVKPRRPNMYVLGGGKPKDCIEVMIHLLDEGILDKALCCGVLGEMVLMARGHELGTPTTRFLEKKGLLDLTALLTEVDNRYPKVMEAPIDVACDRVGLRVEIGVDELPTGDMIKDIGLKTISYYLRLLERAETIVVKGPAGVYEERGFDVGTRGLLEGIKGKEAFTLIGGGDTSVALNMLGIGSKGFSYVSIAGGALITCLSGRPMPGVDALRKTVSPSKA